MCTLVDNHIYARNCAEKETKKKFLTVFNRNHVHECAHDISDDFQSYDNNPGALLYIY
jgi:hypothetical protein